MPRATLTPLRRRPSTSDTDHDTISPPRYPPHKSSSLSYNSRDVRDRANSRNPRNLVVVIPPPDLPLNQGQLGNLLSVGPRHRLSQGTLMPLFPSMFGQLNAIAREYNFPSTIGLCLYLHINENGSTMTPRISDDSWNYLFGHLFDGRSPTGGQLPIGGSIEFDIDLNKARWYDAWASGTLRDMDAIVVPHRRGESLTINPAEQPLEDRWNLSSSQTLVNSSRPETLRNLPRKLSLLDRFEPHSARVAPKGQDLESPPTHGPYASSPIFQVRGPPPVPKLAGSDLERRVRSWRETTEIHPVSMVESYQPVPDRRVAADMTMDAYALAPNFLPIVDIDDFVWSVSSVGPPDSPTATPIASTRPSSVHIDRRANGTVPLTPDTMTSWGPTEDEWHTVVSTATQLPSPDMGQRVVEDAMAPRHRAVWGNSFGWRSAVTWKRAYPYSIRPVQVRLRDADGTVPEYPGLVIYPTVGAETLPSRKSVWESSFGWYGAVTWRKVYSYSDATRQSLAPVQLRGAGYPILSIYPAAYPHFDIYPEEVSKDAVSRPASVMLGGSNELLTYYPAITIYPAAYPYFDIYPPVSEGVEAKGMLEVPLSVALTSYPNLVIYPVAYPQFDLYPKALQVAETSKPEVVVRLMTADSLVAEYPHMTIYPCAYPYLEMYPACALKRQSSTVSWGVSFGWLTAKTWLQVYPIHNARLSTEQLVGRTKSVPMLAVAGKQAVWGGSFGWKNAKTWRAVWPTPYATVDPVFVYLRPQSESASNYPFLVIYPAAYPHFDIYPACAVVANSQEPQSTKENQLAPHYPNIMIYRAAYPHFDLYPSFAKDLVTASREGESNLRRRRVEMWRAKTAAQVGLAELLANNHNWEIDEPLRVNLEDYAWSQTSAGPCTPVELDTPSVPRSVHLDRLVRGSVPRTPSTATTWGPQNDDWYSEISSIERLPSPDLGQRLLDDAEDFEFPYKAWHLSAPEQSVLVPEYPCIVIYPPAYPHFDLYPTWVNATTPVFKNQVTETLTNLNLYPTLDVYPAVYPHFNIYPTVLSQIEIPSQAVSNVRHERVLASPYPHFDIYPASHPYIPDYASPFTDTTESSQIVLENSLSYPSLVVYPPVYPHIILYPGSAAEIRPPLELEHSYSLYSILVNVKLAVLYPLLDVYPAGYPWSLESIYPAISIEVDECSVVLKALYPSIFIYATVYPFVQPYPGISETVLTPGALDEAEYDLAQAYLSLMELEPIYITPTVYPHFDLYPGPLPSTIPGKQDPVQSALVGDSVAPLPRRRRKTHTELHASVFRCLGKRRAQSSKTHHQLHHEVFQDGVVWTPSGYVQDLSSLMTRKGADVPLLNLEPPRRRPSHESPAPRNSRSRSGTTTTVATDKVVFPLGQPPALPPITPFRVRTSGAVPSQPSPAVSEIPVPRISSPPPSAYTHMRSTSARLSQAVRSIMPGGARRNSSSGASPTMPMSPSEEYRERVKGRQSPTRFLSMVDRRPGVAPPLPGHTSEFLTRPPRNPPTQDSFVLQRARAYEQPAAINLSPSPKGVSPPFVLPPLPPLTPMSDVTDVIGRSRTAVA